MDKIRVMMSGLYIDDTLGKMARLIATSLQKDDRFELLPVALGGPEINDHLTDGARCVSTEIGKRTIHVVAYPYHRELLEDYAKAAREEYNFIIVDFTHPSAVNRNAELYCEFGIPFVMGTTGGDRESLVKIVEDSGNTAVIAPNMAPQIVGFQAMMEYAAKTFPGLFEGYSLEVVESHQASKADTSGTARAVVESFNRMGVEFNESQINKKRDPQWQKTVLRVPREYLDGHGWHTYALTSPDGNVKFRFTHNVNGRDIYVEGVKKSLFFLTEHTELSPGYTWNMIDVLKNT